jgi:hypothetical protein
MEERNDMGYMKAIALEGGELVEELAKADISNPYDGSAAETARGAGWVSPTEAWLCCELLGDILERGTLDESDTKQVLRIKGILGKESNESE